MKIKSIIAGLCLMSAMFLMTSCAKRELQTASGSYSYTIANFSYITNSPTMTNAQREQASKDLQTALLKTCKDMNGKEFDFAKVAFDGVVIPYTGSAYKPFTMDLKITQYAGAIETNTYVKKYE